MENLDKIVDLITDRLMDKIQVESYKSSVFVIGAFDTPDILDREGYQVEKKSSCADIILVESIGFDAMLRIASLCPLTADEAVVIKSLLKGKKVLVLNESFDFHQYKFSKMFTSFTKIFETTMLGVKCIISVFSISI